MKAFLGSIGSAAVVYFFRWPLLGLARKLLERYVYIARDGYMFQAKDANSLQQAIEADLRDEAAAQDMPDYERMVWLLNIRGMREVFAIARAEADDEVALLSVMANTNFDNESDE